jgi:hypothetical protein
MKLIRVAILSIGFVFVFAAVALGQHGNWFEPIAASPKPTFREYNTAAVPLRSGKPSLLIAAFALPSLPAGLRAQVEIPIAKNPMNESLDAWNARFVARETQSGKSAVPESQAMLQPGILQVAGQASVKPWSMVRFPPTRRVPTGKAGLAWDPGPCRSLPPSSPMPLTNMA